MTIGVHIDQFFGLPVTNFDPSQKTDLIGTRAWRVSVAGEDAYEPKDGNRWADVFSRFLHSADTSKLVALIVGLWEEAGAETTSKSIVEALVAARSKLPNLKALFIGEMITEESEVSWINQSDISPLFAAYPALECLYVRGGIGLSLGSLRHARLKDLVLQTGGLPLNVVSEVCHADLPALEHLELWLGSSNYGWDGTVESLAPILSGELFPRLKYLGIKDSEIQDEIAIAVAKAPILGRIETLDLSMGVLSDEGAKALLASPFLRRLKTLDIHHHYVSDTLVRKLGAMVGQFDGSEAQKAATPDDRYIAVSE